MSEILSRSFQPSVNASLKGSHQDSRFASGGGLVKLPKLGKCLGLVRPLFILARERLNWSPFKILGELWRLFASFGMRREMLSLLKLRPFDEIVQNYPGLTLNYVVRNYLVRGFTVAERASCFLHHYRRIHAALPEDVLRQILRGFVILHEKSDCDNCFALTIGLPRPPIDKEGELSLVLQVNGKRVFSLGFIIVPGWVVESEVAEVLLITHLQGTRGCNSQIKLACRAFNDYSPRGPLLAALQGVADAFGISEIEAVCATKQKSYRKEHAAILKRTYDDFFTKVGMVKTTAGFYSSSIPIEGRPLASFKGNARSRAKKRRAMRQNIQSACASFFSRVSDRAADSSRGAVCLAPAPETFESRPNSIFCPTPDNDLTI